MKLLDQQYASINLVSMISRHGTDRQATNARDAELLTRERLCRGLSMFEVVMQKVKTFLVKDKVCCLCVCVCVCVCVRACVGVPCHFSHGVVSSEAAVFFRGGWHVTCL